jgi:hypothetical protein
MTRSGRQPLAKRLPSDEVADCDMETRHDKAKVGRDDPAGFDGSGHVDGVDRMPWVVWVA